MLLNIFSLKHTFEQECDFIENVQGWICNEFPIYTVSCNFNLARYKAELYNELHINLPDNIRNSVDKRQAEFLAGRYLAKKALMNYQSYSGKLANEPIIHIGPDREPVWPNGFLGSITHNSSLAMCSLTNNLSIYHVGIDVETILSISSAEELAYQICTDEEIALLASQGLQYNIAVTLVFSAKESLFKALYPTIKSYFGFECAKACDFTFANNTLSLRLTDDFAVPKDINKKIFLCYFEIQKHHVKTMLFC